MSLLTEVVVVVLLLLLLLLLPPPTTTTMTSQMIAWQTTRKHPTAQCARCLELHEL